MTLRQLCETSGMLHAKVVQRVSEREERERAFEAKVKAVQEEQQREFSEKMQAVEMREKAFDEKVKAYDVKLHENAAVVADLVTFDVRGKPYKTRKSNLMKLEGSYFAALLGSGGFKPDTPDGSYFVDKDQKHFDLIWGHAIDGRFHLDAELAADKEALAKLVADFDYFGVDLPVQLQLAVAPPKPKMKWTIDPDEGWNREHCTLSNGDLTATATGNGCQVRGNAVSNRFTVRLDAIPTEVCISMVGTDDRVWRMDVAAGRLWSLGGVRLYAAAGVWSCNVGDRITMVKEGSDIRFEKNGVSLGVAFTAADGVPADEVLTPIVTMTRVGNIVTLVEDSA